MKEQHTWERAVTSVQDMYRGLSPDIRLHLDTLIEKIMQFKQDLVRMSISVGSTSICRSCGGTCCLYGKYHLSILDVMAYMASATDLVVPDFSKTPCCPYSGPLGCMMAPQYRPMTCVVFNCELIEELLTTPGRDTLRTCEKELRDTISRANRLTAIRLDRPVLLVPGQDTTS